MSPYFSFLGKRVGRAGGAHVEKLTPPPRTTQQLLAGCAGTLGRQQADAGAEAVRWQGVAPALAPAQGKREWLHAGRGQSKTTTHSFFPLLHKTREQAAEQNQRKQTAPTMQRQNKQEEKAPGRGSPELWYPGQACTSLFLCSDSQAKPGCCWASGKTVLRTELPRLPGLV